MNTEVPEHSNQALQSLSSALSALAGSNVEHSGHTRAVQSEKECNSANGKTHRGYGATHVGQTRSRNEDAWLVDNELGLYLVCDGLGGKRAGDVASQTACAIIHKAFQSKRENIKAMRDIADRSLKRSKMINMAKLSIYRANAELIRQAETDDTKAGMATTLTLVWIVDSHAVVAHVGDSRVYLIRQGSIRQLTKDHAAVLERLVSGQLDFEQAQRRIARSPVSRVLGGEDSNSTPDILFLDLMSCDRFILCSDGLTRHLNEHDLLHEYRQCPWRLLPARLTAKANENGGSDNITVVTASIGARNSTHDIELKRELRLLRSTKLFKHFRYVDLLHLFGNSTILAFKKHANIQNEGESDNNLYVCLSGEAQMVKQGQVIQTLGAGDMFGGMSVIDKKPAWADVIVSKPARVLQVDRSHFLTLLYREPHHGVRMLLRLTRKLTERVRVTSCELGWSRLESDDSINDTIGQMLRD